MEFRTKIPQIVNNYSLSYKDRIMVTGSCFAENIGTKLDDSGFDVMTNPFGVLYNPFSISNSLRRLISKQVYSEKELVFYDGLYHSFDHHGSFSDINAQAALNKINTAFDKAVSHFDSVNKLMVTFGTAWVYSLAENNAIVANCHKFPSAYFNRFRLDVEDITKDYTELFSLIKKNNPDIEIILTVSPIRHLKDGLHENTLSKSVLHLAVDKICNELDFVTYYPSYEIMMDDLRDYRFYDSDMLHPSSVAKDYIWEHFTGTFFDKPVKDVLRQVQQIRKAINHRPLQDNDEAYRRFAQKNIAAIEMLKSAMPEIDLDEELSFFKSKLW